MTDPCVGAAGIPLLQTAELRHSGRGPAAPFQLRCEDGAIVTVVRLLRVLPGKRIVGEAQWCGRRVLAKLFVAKHGSSRHWERERQGIAALQAAGLATPEVMCAGRIAGGGHFLLTEFLEGSLTLAERWSAVEALPAGDPPALGILQPAFALLGRLHATGLIQTDLHLGNFLEHGDELFLIDGDGIVHAGKEQAAEQTAGQTTLAQQALDNLALLVAQLPLAWESCLDVLAAAYASEQDRLRPDRETLLQAVERARAHRLTHFLGKTLRDCSQFAVRSTTSLFSAVVRTEKDALAELLDYPDGAIAQGVMLKDGNTCTVARIEAGGRALVVKRYNLKSFRHALSRFWRPSRAWHSWVAGHRLAFYGIATPAPLAMLEERVGPLRRRAFLVTEFCPGESLMQRLSPEREPDADEAAAILALFGALFRRRISHGDMKATNFIWNGERLAVIDLDAMVQHDSLAAFVRDWRRDRQRFLRNWPAHSAPYRWLDANLPEA